uniref:Thioredoxin domain-containing protein n=1 Tax=viral metagenome TaxID=1070528 RepID=A0A6C0K9K1_9ZZZZ
MNPSIINVKTLSEYSQILKNNRYVVANFSASFCKPCKEIAPFIEELVVSYPNMTFLKIDIEDASDISDYHNITSIPFFKFYKNEIEITSYCGTDKRIIREALDNMTCMYL